MRVLGITPFNYNSCLINKSNTNGKSKTTSATDSFVKSKNVSFGHISVYDMPNLHCAYCDKLMVSRKYLAEMIKEAQGRTANGAIKILEPYYDRLQNTQANIFDQIARIAKREPGFKIQDVMKHGWKQHLLIVEEEQQKVFNMIDCLDLELSTKTLNKLNKYLITSREILFAKNNIHTARRTQVMSMLNDLEKSCNEKEELAKVRAILTRLPSAETNYNAFFVKHSQDNTEGVFQALCTPSFVTKDHITAQTTDIGEKSVHRNYLYVHAYCNNNIKGDKRLSELLEYRPKLDQYIQTNVDELTNGINQGLLDPKAFSLNGVKEKVYQESGNQIKITVQKSHPPQKTRLFNIV